MTFLLLRYILDNIVDEREGAFCGWIEETFECI